MKKYRMNGDFTAQELEFLAKLGAVVNVTEPIVSGDLTFNGYRQQFVLRPAQLSFITHTDQQDTIVNLKFAGRIDVVEVIQPIEISDQSMAGFNVPKAPWMQNVG